MSEKSPYASVVGMTYLPTTATVRSASVLQVTTHGRSSPVISNDVNEQQRIRTSGQALRDTVPMDTSEAADTIAAPDNLLHMHPARLRNLQSTAKPEHSFPPELSRDELNKFRGFKTKERKLLWSGLQHQLKGEEAKLFLKQTKGWGKGEKDEILKRWDVQVKGRRGGKKVAARLEAVKKQKTKREMGECLEMMEVLGMESRQQDGD